MSATGSSARPDAEFSNFRDLARRLIAVPKSEVPKHVVKKRVKVKATKPKGQ